MQLRIRTYFTAATVFMTLASILPLRAQVEQNKHAEVLRFQPRLTTRGSSRTSWY